MQLNQPTTSDRILAVDDTPDNLFLIEAILSDEGYQVDSVEDGATALAKIAENPPALVLLDVMMPHMDGYEVTRRIRSMPGLSYIPILLITAHDKSSVVEGLDAGADDFVRKPVDPDELSARVRSLLRLKHTIDALEDMNRQREDFVSRMTHDLRTPLVAADRMLNLFTKEAFCPISDDMKEAVAAMIRSNQNLLQMVNTLLEVHRYEAGHKNLTFAPCDLAEITKEIIEELQPLATDKAIELRLSTSEWENAPPEGAMVLGDRLELRRVVTNLVGNAIKFTERGSVTVRINRVNYRSDLTSSFSNSQVQLEVEDTGPGISTSDQPNLFERFKHGKSRRSGSGLGLYLSRRIIEAHGGVIEVQSSVGQGSTFTVYLPEKADVKLRTA